MNMLRQKRAILAKNMWMLYMDWPPCTNCNFTPCDAVGKIVFFFSMWEKMDASSGCIRAESREGKESKSKFSLMGSHIRRCLGGALLIRNRTTHFTMVTRSVFWKHAALGQHRHVINLSVIYLRVQPTENEKANISESAFIVGTLLRRWCSLAV